MSQTITKLEGLSDHDQRLHRIGFLEGAIEGIRLYSIWRNGVQLVGCMERPLGQVLEPYQEELDRLIEEGAMTGNDVQ